MPKIAYMIEIYNKRSDGDDYGSVPSTVVTDAIAFDSDGSISTTADSFQFRVNNYQKANGTYAYTNKFKVDDRVMIYITGTTELIDSSGTPISTKSSYQVFDGIITEIIEETTTSGRIVQIRGLNRLEKMMNMIFPGIFKNEYADEMIKELIGHVNGAQRQVPGSSQRLNQITYDSNSIDDTSTTKISYSRNYRTVFELVEELSRQKINKHFNAYYYLDKNNKFYWKQKSKNIDNLELEEGIDFSRAKWRHKVWDVINAMIVDCGNDPKGNAIHAMNYDEASAAEYGLKWAPGIEVATEISSIVIGKVQDYIQENTVSGWEDTDNDGFPDSYGAKLYLGFYERGADGELTAVMASATSDATYNAAIRKEIKWEGIDWIKSVLDLTGKVRPRLDVTMQGTHWEANVLDGSSEPLNQGDFVKIIPKSTSISYNESYDGLRLMAISHTLDRNGWVVDLNLETDVEDFEPSRYSGEDFET